MHLYTDASRCIHIDIYIYAQMSVYRCKHTLTTAVYHKHLQIINALFPINEVIFLDNH